MAKQIINRGTNANDGTGDNLRDGGNKINLNFNEIYTAIGDGTTINGTIKVSDDSSTVTTLSANGENLRVLGGTAINTSISGNTLTIAADTSSILTASGTTTLTNKTLNLANNTVTGTLAEFNTAVSDATLVDLDDTQTLTNKTISADSNTLSGIAASSFVLSNGSGNIDGSASQKAIPSGTVVGTSDTQTLTNKTISGADNTITNISSANVTGAFDNTSSGSKIRFNFANVGSFPSETTYEGMFAYDTGGNQAYVADSGGWTKLINENASVGDLSNVNIVGVADGQALIWSSAQGRFNPGTAGTELTVQEEGSSLSTAADTLNFVGSRITASGTGTTKTITVTNGAAYEDTSTRLVVTYNLSSSYRFGHYGSTDNPTIYAKQGQTIAFDLTALNGAHPFAIQTSSGAYNSANRISTGLTHVATDGTVTTGLNAQGKTSGVLYFEVPSDQQTVYYVCTSHPAMNGTLHITNKAPVAFSAKLGSDQGSISASTSTVLIFDTEDFDSNGAYDTSNGRFTVPSGEGGKYCLNAVFRTNSSGTMVRCNISLRKNGSATIAQFNNNQRSSGEASSAVTWCGTLAAGDYVDVRIFQDSSTGTVAAVAGDGKTMYSGHKILGV